jgi:hypothetical protein
MALCSCDDVDAYSVTTSASCEIYIQPEHLPCTAKSLGLSVTAILDFHSAFGKTREFHSSSRHCLSKANSQHSPHSQPSSPFTYERLNSSPLHWKPLFPPPTFIIIHLPSPSPSITTTNPHSTPRSLSSPLRSLAR